VCPFFSSSFFVQKCTHLKLTKNRINFFHVVAVVVVAVDNFRWLMLSSTCRAFAIAAAIDCVIFIVVCPVEVGPIRRRNQTDAAADEAVREVPARF